MRGRTILLVFVAIAVFFGCANSAFAQGAATAQLSGTVTDPSGGAVSGAMVEVRNVATNTTSTAGTNASGFYAFASLAPGTYELKTSFSGFSNYTQTGIVLTVGQTATVNVALQLASQGERVVVTTEAQTIEPTKTEISQVVGTTQIQSLPINGRLFTDFALLTPGVATSRTSLGTTFTEYETTQISFGGMRSFSNEITVDGADFVNAASGVQRATPPQESVQEFRVVNNSFGAESGRALGGIVNIVTKSRLERASRFPVRIFPERRPELPQPSAETGTGIAVGAPAQGVQAKSVRRDSWWPNRQGQDLFLHQLRRQAARRVSSVST